MVMESSPKFLCIRGIQILVSKAIYPSSKCSCNSKCLLFVRVGKLYQTMLAPARLRTNFMQEEQLGCRPCQYIKLPWMVSAGVVKSGVVVAVKVTWEGSVPAVT